MDRREIESVERDDVTREDLKAVLKQVLLSPTASRSRSVNREPTREVLNRR